MTNDSRTKEQIGIDLIAKIWELREVAQNQKASYTKLRLIRRV